MGEEIHGELIAMVLSLDVCFGLGRGDPSPAYHTPEFQAPVVISGEGKVHGELMVFEVPALEMLLSVPPRLS